MNIAAEERGANNIFARTGIAASYTWNSALIDGTYILRSIPDIGRKRNYPLDTNLNAVSK